MSSSVSDWKSEYKLSSNPGSTDSAAFLAFFSTWVCVCVCVCEREREREMSEVTSQDIARQAPLSMEFSRQHNWGGLSFPMPGIFPKQGSKRHLLCLLPWEADSLPTVPPIPGGKVTSYSWQILPMILTSLAYKWHKAFSQISYG